MSSSPSGSQTISFRLQGEPLQRLRAHSTDTSKSLGQVARELVMDGVLNERQADLERELAEVRTDVASLRENLATVLEVLLLNFTDVPDDDVRKFVSEKLRVG